MWLKSKKGGSHIFQRCGITATWVLLSLCSGIWFVRRTYRYFVSLTLFPLFLISVPALASTVWPSPPSTQFELANLEGQTSYCEERSIRWDVPFFLDLNLDGLSDFIVAISCYRDPVDHSTKHNNVVWSAWRAFCSDAESESHKDCTNERFLTDEIRVTGIEDRSFHPSIDGGGGNPYTHVAEIPRDLNGDGYPEVWYALNRDDGRPGFDYVTPDLDDLQLLRELCQVELPDPNRVTIEDDCTRESMQSMLMSHEDGSYTVEYLPWGPVNAQTILALPNTIGTFDLWAMIYGEHRVARWQVDGGFADVTFEYQQDEQWNAVAYTGDVYANIVRLGAETYIVKAGIPNDYFDYGYQDSFRASAGFMLWHFDPAAPINSRFTLSDVYAPEPNDWFEYNTVDGGKDWGAYLNGVPVFSPRWHFFDFESVDDSGEPILLVRTESFSQLGRLTQEPPDPNVSYYYDSFPGPTDIEGLLGEGQSMQGFSIVDGRLVPIERQIIEGGTIKAAWLRFTDLDGDGLNDLIALSGGLTAPSIYRNDGEGFFQRLYLGDEWPNLVEDSSYWSDSDEGWMSASALVPLYSEGKLDLLYWDQTPGDLSIVRARADVTDLPIYALERQHRDVERCINAGYLQFYSTPKQTCRIAGLPATAPDTPRVVSVQVVEGVIEITVDGYDGGAEITRYEATCIAGETTVTGSGASSVIRVAGLIAGDYVCSVIAVNSVGPSEVALQTSPVTVAIDTDGDGIDDTADEDDDNDGFSDSDEEAFGSDPLDSDSTPTVPRLSAALLLIAWQELGNSPQDVDNDGVVDDADQCPNTPAGATVDANGCAESQKDDDNDGVSNDADQCPDTPAGAIVDANGCAESQKDDDGDGVSNDSDQCPDTEPGVEVDATGCSDASASVEQVYTDSIDALIVGGGCTSSGCHGRSSAPGGLVLRNNATSSNYTSLVNYINNRGGTRLLNKIAGVSHGGGRRYSSSSSQYAAIEAWVRSVEALP